MPYGITGLERVKVNLEAGHAQARLAEALRYKPRGRGFDIWILHWYNPSGRIMALGSDSVSNRNECRGV